MGTLDKERTKACRIRKYFLLDNIFLEVPKQLLEVPEQIIPSLYSLLSLSFLSLRIYDCMYMYKSDIQNIAVFRICSALWIPFAVTFFIGGQGFQQLTISWIQSVMMTAPWWSYFSLCGERKRLRASTSVGLGVKNVRSSSSLEPGSALSLSYVCLRGKKGKNWSVSEKWE